MKPKPIFALVDSNNFFVSCERLFRPDLENKPLVVLSSNDGCVVSRSNEAKALGIPMGAPAFKFRDVFRAREVIQFSANFELYANISRRLVNILSWAAPRIEIYSIDESFLDLTSLKINDYQKWGRELRQKIWHEVGIPVSIGVAPTKTLAKLAVSRAKKDAALGGALSLQLPADEREKFLVNFPIEKIWGIGRRLAPKLRAEGISDALTLSQLGYRRARQLMGLSGRQMVSELNGLSCFEISTAHAPPKTIMRGRTFGKDTGNLETLQAAIASLVSRASLALRQENLLAARASLYLATNRHKPGFRSWNEAVNFSMPTADTGVIAAVLTKKLTEIYRPDHVCHRAVVTLYDFSPSRVLQTDIFEHVQPELHDRSTARMRAIDKVNTRFGRSKIRYAAEDLSQSWQPTRERRSPRYTSDWSELPEIRIQPW